MKTKHINLLMLVVTFGLYAVISFGLALPYQYANTDIVLYTSVLPEILTVLIDLGKVALFAFAFSVLIYTSYMRYPTSSVLKLMGILSCATLFRWICDLAVILIVFHVLGARDFAEAVTYFLLDLVLIWVVFCLIRHSARRYEENYEPSAASNTLFGDHSRTEENSPRLSPFKKIYSKENPIQTCLLTIGILLSAVKIVPRVIYDIDYGAPEDMSEIAVMAAYYCSDLLIGVIFYVLSVLILGRLLRKTQ